MIAKPVLLAAAALALVSGCSGGSANNSSSGGDNGTAAGANSAAAGSGGAAANGMATNMAAPGGASSEAPESPVDRAFVTGHWGVRDCTRTLSFNPDGSVAGGTIDRSSRWTLEGSTLTVKEGNGPPEPAEATRVGDRLRLSGPQNQRITLTRCPSAAMGAPPAGPRGAPPVPAN